MQLLMYACVCMHAHALQLLTDKIKGKPNGLIAPVCLRVFFTPFPPPPSPRTLPSLNAATVNEIVSSRFASFAAPCLRHVSSRLVWFRLLSLSLRLRSSTDVTVDEATLWHQMQTVHAPPSLFLLLLIFLLFFFFYSFARPASALSAQVTVRISLQLFVDFFIFFCIFFYFFVCLQSAKAKKFTQHRARLSKAKSVKFL